MANAQYISRARNLYYVPDSSANIKLPLSSETVTLSYTSVLVTIMSSEDVEFWGSIENVIDHLLTCDDVYSSDFFEGVVVQFKDIKTNMATKGSTRCFIGGIEIPVNLIQIPYDEPFLLGPYARLNNRPQRIWKIFPDTHGAFVSSIVDMAQLGLDAKFTFKELAVPMSSGLMGVAVPSRLYYPISESYPLNGLRIAVKDNIHLAGVATGAGSKAYAKLHQTQHLTAYCIQKLVELGAIIVGKTKTAQFADGDTTTSDWVDFSCPWNPRGDEYLIASGSSTGSACAVAAYDWIDAGIGTDTLGSIRGPALWQGIYGVRPTFDSLSMDGILPVSK